MKKAKKIISILIVIILLLLNFSSCSIYNNIYGTEHKGYDVYSSAEIHGDELTITIRSLIDIKDLEYNIKPTKNSERYFYHKDFLKANEPLIHTYKLQPDEKNEINYSWNTTKGNIKNGEKNIPRQETIEYNQCSISYEFFMVKEKYMHNNEEKEIEVYNAYCYITNNTPEKILSIEGNTIAKINNKNEFELYIKKYDFDNPLLPGETRKIKLKFNQMEIKYGNNGYTDFEPLVEKQIDKLYAGKTKIQYLFIIYE